MISLVHPTASVVSGSGNVSIYTIEKCLELGAKVVTASDSSGYILDKDGFDAEKLAYLKEVRGGRIHEYAEKFGCEFFADQRPWGCPATRPSPARRRTNCSPPTRRRCSRAVARWLPKPGRRFPRRFSGAERV